ncbi:hypothetical protein GUITHDRAFT_102576 [Guillardia theta CCMP2712]|uniref:Rhodanese domain-containing protein n=2 Tax=Guillardia theta TaxID=55529 RepID=L1JUH6_GUITC|nr:hypothetical protein GUITHDRAFT_102576 [Guillardia theta CCMP2712]EKX51964.1 hypothetical protein GUITHDRAFT_102576 [Guillardia theta CCMP2712]|eukprot:XP_005838944.1 hypothetical protein GUITHDRAFT_102576 [Guillardia theta CCMP2712]
MSEVPKKTPAEAKKLCDSEGFTYVDVRTNEEFARGHPTDAINIPAFAITGDGPMPMSSTFLKLIQTNFPNKDEKLVIGCQAGNRSAMACKWLSEAGYTNIVESNKGFSGW